MKANDVALRAAPTLAAPARRNTKNLPLRLSADLLSASFASALIAPIISIIDRSIMENASGRASISQSLRSSAASLLRSPRALLLSRPCALVFLLYTGTYATANAVDTCSSTLRALPAASTTAGPAKFFASSAANVGLCVYKDQVFARMFGPVSSAVRPVALPSYVLFTLRDCLTIFASFNLPPRLAPLLDKGMPAGMRKYVAGATAAQMLAPAGLQLLSTPVHLLGLDLYNRPAPGPSLRERFSLVRAHWLVSSLARMGRIVPAFGVGGVCNMKIRQSLMRGLD